MGKNKTKETINELIILIDMFKKALFEQYLQGLKEKGFEVGHLIIHDREVKIISEIEPYLESISLDELLFSQETPNIGIDYIILVNEKGEIYYGEWCPSYYLVRFEDCKKV